MSYDDFDREPEFADKELQCQFCSNTFEFTASEQKFFSSKGLSQPKRCKSCRMKKKAEQEARASQPQADNYNTHDTSGRERY